MRLPVNSPYRITLKYGATTAPYSKSNPHNGVDLVSSDLKIVAPESGVVTYYADTKGKSGWMLVLQGKYRHSFSHTVARSNKVKVGARVRAGQQLATMGKTGFVTGVHVHWVVSGGTVDPMKLVNKEDDMYKGKSAKYWYERTRDRGNLLDRVGEALKIKFDRKTHDTKAESKSIDKMVARIKQFYTDASAIKDGLFTKIKGIFGK